MRLRVPATSANLGVGFDCIGMAFDFYNYIDFERLDSPGAVELTASGTAGQIDLGKNNLIYKAFVGAYQAVGRPVDGVKMHFENHIPYSRGLGSSSAALIGGIVAANTLMGNPMSEKDMLRLALKWEGHPDNIAPALLGGIVIGVVDGEDILYRKFEPPKGLSCTVVIPDYPLATKKAREVLPKEISMKDAIFNIGRMGMLVDALHTGDMEQLRVAMDDRLHQPYRKNLIVGMEEITVAAKALGAYNVTISGAGPTLLIVHDGTPDFSSLADLLREKGVTAEIKSVKPTLTGAQVLDDTKE